MREEARSHGVNEVVDRIAYGAVWLLFKACGVRS